MHSCSPACRVKSLLNTLCVASFLCFCRYVIFMTVTYAVQSLTQWINVMSHMYKIHSAVTSLGLLWSRLLPFNDHIAMEIKYACWRRIRCVLRDGTLAMTLRLCVSLKIGRLTYFFAFFFFPCDGCLLRTGTRCIGGSTCSTCTYIDASLLAEKRSITLHKRTRFATPAR